MTALDVVRERIEQRTGHPVRNGSARCPAHDDSSPSLSISEGGDGRALLFCHAGCDTTSVLAALNLTPQDLFDETPRKDMRPEIVATYDYTDEGGNLLFQVVRLSPKSFRQRRPDGRGGWEWKVSGTRRVLYRLPEIVAAIKEERAVAVVEGEKDALAGLAANMETTTSPGGVGKWRAEYTETLAGAVVDIIADNDAPGLAHAHSVAAELTAAGCDVQMYRPADPHKDLADHLAAGLKPEDLVPIEPTDSAAESNVEPEAPDAKRSAATILVDLALSRFEFGVSTDGDVFGMPIDGPPVVFQLRGSTRSLRAQLARMFYEAYGRAASQSALADALAVLEGQALDAEERQLDLRIGQSSENEIWLDLGDVSGRAVRITSTGWSVEPSAPMLFRRTNLTSATA